MTVSNSNRKSRAPTATGTRTLALGSAVLLAALLSACGHKYGSGAGPASVRGAGRVDSSTASAGTSSQRTGPGTPGSSSAGTHAGIGDKGTAGSPNATGSATGRSGRPGATGLAGRGTSRDASGMPDYGSGDDSMVEDDFDAEWNGTGSHGPSGRARARDALAQGGHRGGVNSDGPGAADLSPDSDEFGADGYSDDTPADDAMPDGASSDGTRRDRVGGVGGTNGLDSSMSEPDVAAADEHASDEPGDGMAGDPEMSLDGDSTTVAAEGKPRKAGRRVARPGTLSGGSGIGSDSFQDGFEASGEMNDDDSDAADGGSGAGSTGRGAAGRGGRAGRDGTVAGAGGRDSLAAIGDASQDSTIVGMIDAPGKRVRVDEDVTPQTLGGMLPLTLGVDEQGQFDFDQAVLRSEVKEVLDHLVERLRNAEYDRLDIIGYTDRIGTADYNQNLSERRAWAVARYLMDQGVPLNKLKVEGLGERESLLQESECAGLGRDGLINCLQRDRRVQIEASIRKSHATVQ